MKTIAQQLKVKDFPFFIKDRNGNKIYYENSKGLIRDNRKKELTMNEIAEKFGMDVNNLKIKK